MATEKKSSTNIIIIILLLAILAVVLFRNSNTTKTTTKISVEQNQTTIAQTISEQKNEVAIQTVVQEKTKTLQGKDSTVIEKTESQKENSTLEKIYIDPFPNSHVPKSYLERAFRFREADVPGGVRRVLAPKEEYILLITLRSGDLIHLDEPRLISFLKDQKTDYIFQAGQVVETENGIATDLPACEIFFNPDSFDNFRYDHSESLSLSIDKVEDLANQRPGFKGLRIKFNSEKWVSRIECLISTKTASGNKYREMIAAHMLNAFGGQGSVTSLKRFH